MVAQPLVGLGLTCLWNARTVVRLDVNATAIFHDELLHPCLGHGLGDGLLGELAILLGAFLENFLHFADLFFQHLGTLGQASNTSYLIVRYLQRTGVVLK